MLPPGIAQRLSASRMQAIKYTRGSLELLNQKLLPHQMVFEDASTVELVYDAIKDMKVRGAPAIAISALLGLAAEIHKLRPISAASPPAGYADLDEAMATLFSKLDFLHGSRPTAVNLGNAISECKARLTEAAKGSCPRSLPRNICQGPSDPWWTAGWPPLRRLPSGGAAVNECLRAVRAIARLRLLLHTVHCSLSFSLGSKCNARPPAPTY